MFWAGLFEVTSAFVLALANRVQRKVSFNRSSYEQALEGFSNVAVMVSQQDYDYTAATSQGNYGNSVKVHSRV